jgi:hypothetical protein
MAEFKSLSSLLEAVELRAEVERDRAQTHLAGQITSSLQPAAKSLEEWSLGLRKELSLLRASISEFPIIIQFSIGSDDENGIGIAIDMAGEKPEVRFRAEYMIGGMEKLATRLAGDGEMKLSQVGLERTDHFRFLDWRTSKETATKLTPLICSGKDCGVGNSNTSGLGFWLFLAATGAKPGVHECNALRYVIYAKN